MSINEVISVRTTLNELIAITDALVEQAKKRGNQTAQEKWNEEKEALHKEIDDDWNEVVNKELDINVEWLVSKIKGIDLESEEEA